jgi:hypothetical protein
MASIAIRTQVRRWVSAYRKLARLPSERRTASIPVCSCWSANNCAIGTTSPESSPESPRDVGRASKTDQKLTGVRFIVIKGVCNNAGAI